MDFFYSFLQNGGIKLKKNKKTFLNRKKVRIIAAFLTIFISISLISNEELVKFIKLQINTKILSNFNKEEFIELSQLQSYIEESREKAQRALRNNDSSEAKTLLKNIYENINDKKDAVREELNSIYKKSEKNETAKNNVDSIKSDFEKMVMKSEDIELAIDSGKDEDLQIILNDEDLFGNKKITHNPLGESLPNKLISRDYDVLQLSEVETNKECDYSIDKEITDESIYLNNNIETKLTEEIKNKADEIGNDPLKLYEFVRNTVHYDPYYGSRKGAIGTYEQVSGNDYDQSSLLIALFRYYNIPARYVEGTIELKPEKAMGWTGTNTIEAAARVLASSGNPTTSILNGGKIVAIRVKHVWVEAYCCNNEYRGKGEKTEEKQWIPFDPSFKTSKYIDGIDIVKEAEIDTEHYSNFGIQSEVTSDGLGVKNVGSDFLTDSFEDMILDVKDNLDEDKISKMSGTEIFGGYEIEKEELELLPYSIPNTLVSIDNRFNEIDIKDKDYISISLNDTVGLYGELNYSFSAVEVYDKKITITWEPASEEDKKVIAQYGDIYKTPAYLIQVKPVLMIDGEVVARGTSIGFGEQEYVNIDINRAGLSNQRITNVLDAGGYYAIGLDYGIVSPRELDNIKNNIEDISKEYKDPSKFFEDERAGDLLNANIKLYFAQVDTANKLLANKKGIINTRALSCGMTGFSPKISYLVNKPVSVKLANMYIDIDADVHSIVNIDNDTAKEKQYSILTGYISSSLENSIIEQLSNKDSVSTVKIFNEANNNGIAIYEVNSENIDEVLKVLKVDDYIKTDIRNSVDSGNIVLIPEKEITYGDWEGTGYVVQDPVTGSAGYMISGGNAGGSNAEDMSDIFSNADVLEGFVAGFLVGFIKGFVTGYIAGFILGVLGITCQWLVVVGIVVGLLYLISDIVEIASIYESYCNGEISAGSAAYLIGEIIGEFVGGIFGGKKGAEDADVQCFVENTKIMTQNDLKNIQDVKIGDYIYSNNLETGKNELKKVVNVFQHETNSLVKIVFANSIVQCTLEHPFYVENIGYVEARDLVAGDKLHLFSGESVEVELVEILTLQEAEKVYNLEVEDAHNYYVTDEGILVHNKCRKPRRPRKNVLSEEPTATGGMKYEIKSKTTGEVYTIEYNSDGYPVFDDFAMLDANGDPIKVEIDYTGKRGKDFRLANEKAGFTSTPEGYTWHHMEDGKSMMLVETDVHTSAAHTGGFSIFKLFSSIW